MKYLHIITPLVLAAASLFAADPTSGQWKFEKKNAGAGFTLFGVTPEVSKAFGLDGSGNPAMLTVGSGSGTVTSVSLAAPAAIFDVSGSPVTTSGGFTITFDNQNANVVFAGPTNGAAAAPTMRALVEADVPNLSASKVTSGTVATARLGSGTANSGTFLRGDQTWQAVSGGGGQLSQWAYVDPVNGNDSTGDGTAGSPWATLQKAVGTEGRNFIVLAPGNAGNLSISSDRVLTITGAGRDVTTVGSVTVTNAASITLQDLGGYSFTVSGNITVTGTSNGQSGGNARLIGVFGESIACIMTGQTNASVGGAGGDTGSLFLTRSELSSVVFTGGEGGPGDCSNVSGSGGNISGMVMDRSKLSSSIDSTPGAAGADGGSGQGAAGSNGSLSARFSEYGGTTLGSSDVHASLVNGTWTD